MDVDLTDDLVGCAAPGDVVTVVGLVRVASVSDRSAGGGDKGAAAAGLFVIYVDAVSVVPAGGGARWVP